MSGCYKIKYILLIATICLLNGCSTVSQDTAGSVPGQKPEDVKVTDEARPAVTEALTDEIQSTDEARLKEAISFIQDKKYPQAIGLLSQIKDNGQAEDLLEQVRYIISGAYIADLGAGIAALDNDGRVKIITDDTLYKYYGYDEASGWTGIKQLSYAQARLDALDRDGVIHSTRDPYSSDDYIADQLKSYTELSAISTDYDNYILLSKTGKLYIYSAKRSYMLDQYKDYISTWRDVVDVITGQLRIAALNRDGTVYVADYNKYPNRIDYLYDEIADWTDIVDISAGSGGPIAGLKSDGTVVISTDYIKGFANYYSYEVSDWNDIIAISKGHSTLLGLKRDGTVAATGDNRRKQLEEISGWTDIAAVAAGTWFSIGLKSDGTLVIAGEAEEGVTTPDVTGVDNLYVPVVTY